MAAHGPRPAPNHHPAPMKASRAYIAGLGTTGVLIASFVLTLVVVSAIVAFNGVPGQASSDRLDAVEIRQGSSASASRSDQPVARQPARGRDRRPDRARPGTAGAKARGRSAGRSGDGARGGGGLGGGAGGAPGATDDPGPGAASPGAGAANPGAGTAGGRGNGLPRLPASGGGPDVPQVPSPPSVGGATDGLGDTVNDVTGGVGGAVGGPAPNVGGALPPAGETVDGVVDGAGQAVDDTAGGLPSLP
jgi:hypothetical protein